MTDAFSRLLISERSLRVLPSLVLVVGLEEAIILQQLHDWLSRPGVQIMEGTLWVCKSYEEWQLQFPFWTAAHIRCIMKRMKQRGLVKSSHDNQPALDKTRWYTINYKLVERIISYPPVEEGIVS